MTVMFHVLNSGDHIIVSDDVYGGINHYARDFAKEKLNFKIDFADFTNLEEL